MSEAEPAPGVLDDALAAALRGQRPSVEPGSTAAFLELASAHGAIGVLPTDPSIGWPEELLRELRAAQRRLAIWELAHQQLLRRVLPALLQAGAPALLLKGSALAYGVYPDHLLRQRADSDLLVPAGTADVVDRALRALGMERTTAVPTHQATYTIALADGAIHALDVHWESNNSDVLAHLFTYDELESDAVPLPKLHAAARGLSPAHAMLFACVHRASHRHHPLWIAQEPFLEMNRLIWLFDLHLLTQAASQDDWDRFLDIGRHKRVLAICAQAFEAARDRLGTRVPAAVQDAFDHASDAHDLPARYLQAGRVRQQWMDFRAAQGWRARRRRIAALIAPPPEYMKARYADARIRWLPWLYLRRGVLGLLSVAGSRAPAQARSPR